MGPEDPIYGDLTIWSEVRKYDCNQNAYVHIIVFVGFYIYIPGTENTPKRQAQGKRGRRKNMAKTVGGPFLMLRLLNNFSW